MGAMRYKPSDKVRIKSLDWYNRHTNGTEVDCGGIPFSSDMKRFCSRVMTISFVHADCYAMVEDLANYYTDEMIEGLVEEEKKPEFKVGDEVIAYAEGCLAKFSINDVRWNNELNKFEYKICSSWYDASVMQLYKESNNFLIERVSDNGLPFNEWLSHKGAFYIPDGYVLKDENGNVINATKIVLEKKKKEYPKTYEECCRIVNANPCIRLVYNLSDGQKYYHDEDNLYLYETFRRLKICRDAYWKIAGAEMGLGKPWKPDWKNSEERRYCIVNIEGDINLPEKILTKWILKVTNKILVFPTEEMRDAFYENFKDEIEICKELL